MTRAVKDYFSSGYLSTPASKDLLTHLEHDALTWVMASDFGVLSCYQVPKLLFLVVKSII